MNIFMVIILSALIADYVIKITTELLNLKALDEKLPSEFEDVYDVNWCQEDTLEEAFNDCLERIPEQFREDIIIVNPKK